MVFKVFGGFIARGLILMGFGVPPKALKKGRELSRGRLSGDGHDTRPGEPGS